MTRISVTTPVQLSDWRDQELVELFATLPAGAAPSGHLRGQLFAVRGLNALPRSLCRGLYALLSTPINPWRGKSFSNSTAHPRPGSGDDCDLVFEFHRGSDVS